MIDGARVRIWESLEGKFGMKGLFSCQDAPNCTRFVALAFSFGALLILVQSGLEAWLSLIGLEAVVRCQLLAVILVTPYPDVNASLGDERTNDRRRQNRRRRNSLGEWLTRRTLTDWLVGGLWPRQGDTWGTVAVCSLMFCRCGTGLMWRVSSQSNPDALTIAWICWQSCTVAVSLLVGRPYFSRVQASANPEPSDRPSWRALPRGVLACFFLWTVLDAWCGGSRWTRPTQSHGVVLVTGTDWREVIRIMTSPGGLPSILVFCSFGAGLACRHAAPDMWRPLVTNVLLPLCHSAVRYSVLLLSHRVAEALLCWVVWCQVGALRTQIQTWLKDASHPPSTSLTLTPSCTPDVYQP